MINITRSSYISYLDKWLTDADRKPLLVRGARQVGKTTLIRNWIPEGRKLLELNFEERPDARTIFQRNLDVARLIEELELFFGTRIEHDRVILFFDEVQIAPEAITSLRFFYEKSPGIPVIAAGSLLEFALSEISFPVGRVQSLFLRPLAFDEFVKEIGGDVLYDYLARIDLQSEPLVETAHQELLSLAMKYFQVGGMPTSVAKYSQDGSLISVAAAQRLLVNGYRDDFPKYGRRINLDLLNLVYGKVANVCGSSRVKYTFFSRDHRAHQIKSALELLSDAHIINKIHVTHGGIYPTAAGIDVDLFKISHLDIGLMQSAIGLDWRLIPSGSESLQLFNGQLAEQFVAQELAAKAPLDQRPRVTFWERLKAGADAEVDFLIEAEGRIIPAEVKSGTRGTLRSLRQYVENFHPPYSLVLSANNIARDQGVIFMPFYAIGSILSKMDLPLRD